MAKRKWKHEDFPDFESHDQQKFQDDPIGEIEAARKDYAAAHNGYNARLRDMLERAYGIAYAFRKRPIAWQTFRLNAYFEANGLTPGDDNHLKWSLAYIMAASGTRDMDRVNKFARALKPFQQSGLPTHKVARSIKNAGGIEALIKQAGKKRPVTAQNPPDDSYYDLGPEAEPDPESQPKLVIEVECTEKQLARVMKLGRKGRELTLKIAGLGRMTREKYGKPKGWRRFKALKIARKRKPL